jgi:hypothetical protein
MDQQAIIHAIIFSLATVAAGLGLWYLGVRYNILALKQMAVMIGVVPSLVFGAQIAIHLFGADKVTLYKTWTRGPGRREASFESRVPFQVNYPEAPQQIDLTPKPRIGETPSGSVHLAYKVLSPSGQLLAEGEQTVNPAGKYWATIRTQFQTRDQGEHALILEIPSPIGEVGISILELTR